MTLSELAQLRDVYFQHKQAVFKNHTWQELVAHGFISDAVSNHAAEEITRGIPLGVSMHGGGLRTIVFLTTFQHLGIYNEHR